jgi:2,3-dihydroxybenzoate-AMP ligase
VSQPRLPGAVGWPADVARRYRELGLWRGESLAGWFDERARRYADNVAVVDGDRSTSYRELRSAVARLATGLRRAGIRELDCVVLQLPNSLELVQALLALTWLGAVPVLALPAHRRIELGEFVGRSRARALIVPARDGATDMLEVALQVQRDRPELRTLIAFDPGRAVPEPFVSLTALLTETELPLLASTGGPDVALLQLSGGSTGVPKLIARTHDDYLYSVRESAALCELSPQTRFLAALPMTHNFTLSSPGVLGVLDAGGAVVVCVQPHPSRVLRAFIEHEITLVASVPALARAWLEAKPRCLGDLRLPQLTLQVGGARLDSDLARELRAAFGCGLQQVFGMAEGLVNYTRFSDSEAVICETQGRPLSPWDEIRITQPEHPEGPALPPGEVGELQTRGPYTIRGYFDAAAADAGRSAFTRDGFYRTGDLVRLTESGNLVVEGRIGDRILRGGEKIAPAEIEDELRRHPRVRDVAVVGLPDALLGQKSHAFVMLDRADATLSLAELRSFLRGHGLAEFKLPDALQIVAELPRTKVGKTDRAALRDGQPSGS